MDSPHATQINRSKLRAKEFSGGASTKRTIKMLRRIPIHRLRPSFSSGHSEVSQDPEIMDHGTERLLPPLQNPSNIRLITVLPELREGLPQCLVSIHSIDEPFMTLSYTWGPSAVDHTIWLNKVKLNVRCHLWEFLVVASHNFPNVLLWIDALCIDQLNTSERSEQVRRMGDIYAASTETLTFLAATECAGSDTRPGITQDVHTLRDLDHEVQRSLQVLKAREHILRRDKQSCSPKDSFDGHALLSILKIVFIIVCNAYWARLWIIQENILSGASNTIIINDMTVSFTELSSLVTYICKTYKGNVSRRSDDWPNMSDRAPADFDKYQPPTSQDVLHEASDEPPDTMDGWLAEILECTTDPTRIGLITADFLPSTLSHSSELNRYEFLQLMQRVQTSLCSDRRDKIYGLRAFQKSADRFPIDYGEDVYALYFRACRYFEGVMEKENKTSADGQTVTIQAVSASLDLGILDLIFGDDSERTMLATIIRKNSTSEHVTHLDFTGSRVSTDVHSDVFLTCKHCQRYVALESNHIEKLQGCVVQCHRQPHVLEEIQDDHYVIRVDTTKSCRVGAATSWVNLDDYAVSLRSFVVNERTHFSLDQVSWLIYLDELFRRRPCHKHLIPLAEFQSMDTSEPILRDLGTRPRLWSSRVNSDRRRIIRWFLESDDLKELGLEEKAEERMQFLHSQLCLNQNTTEIEIPGELGESQWEDLFKAAMYGHLELTAIVPTT